MKLVHLLDRLSHGAVLHLSLAKRRSWWLHDGDKVTSVGGGTVQAALKRGAIVGAGDSLFTEVPSQTWRAPHHHGGRS
jgi:hypothetical protein